MLLWLAKLYKKDQKSLMISFFSNLSDKSIENPKFFFESLLKSKTNIFYKKWNAFEICNCLKVNFFIFVMMIFCDYSNSMILIYLKFKTMVIDNINTLIFIKFKKQFNQINWNFYF